MFYTLHLQKSSWQIKLGELKMMRNTLPNKSGNLEYLKKSS